MSKEYRVGSVWRFLDGDNLYMIASIDIAECTSYTLVNIRDKDQRGRYLATVGAVYPTPRDTIEGMKMVKVADSIGDLLDYTPLTPEILTTFVANFTVKEDGAIISMDEEFIKLFDGAKIRSASRVISRIISEIVLPRAQEITENADTD